MNLTLLNSTVIDSGELAYIPWELYLLIVGLAFLFFFLSLTTWKSAPITAIIATVMFPAAAALAAFIDFHGVATEVVNSTEIYVVPYSYVVHPPYLAWILMAFFFASLMNVFYVWGVIIKAPKELDDEFKWPRRR